MMGFGIAGGFLALLLLGVLGMGMFRGGHRWTNTRHLRRYMTDFPQDFSREEASLSPLEVLNKRYAAGEISREAYLQMKMEIQD